MPPLPVLASSCAPGVRVAWIAVDCVPIESRVVSVRLLLRIVAFATWVKLPPEAMIVVVPLGLTMLPCWMTELFEVMLTRPAALPAKLTANGLSALTEAVTWMNARVT